MSHLVSPTLSKGSEMSHLEKTITNSVKQSEMHLFVLIILNFIMIAQVFGFIFLQVILDFH